MSPAVPQWVALVGRVLLSAIFVLSGFTKLTNWSGTESSMASHGMPAVPVLLVLAILVERGGGLALLFGCQTRAAATGLVLFLIPTTLIFHNFWAYQGQEQQMQMINFLKNRAIMGGLLKVAADKAGILSVDAAVARSGRRWDVFGVRGRRPVS